MREPATQGNQTLGINVRVYPAQENGKNLLANASVTVGGCFAVRGVRVMNSEKGAFVSMPQRRTAEGEYKDICFPTTKEMRQALNNAVLDAYNKAMEKGQPAMENRQSVLQIIKQISAEGKPPTQGMEKPMDKGAR